MGCFNVFGIILTYSNQDDISTQVFIVCLGLLDSCSTDIVKRRPA